MNKTAVLAVVIIGSLLVLTAIVFLGYRLFSNKIPKARQFAEKIELDSTWKEINVNPPLEAKTEIQVVGLKIENVKGRVSNGTEKLLLQDGSEILIEVQLIDENNQSFDLYPVGIGKYVEFGLKAKGQNKNGKAVGETAFRLGSQFPKIKIRSDKKVFVETAVWDDYTSW
jgi:hypothetical protein